MSNKSMLSILTNFGCHFACNYCIYRENGIKIPKTNMHTFGWAELEEQLKIHKGELISISGGGDPLYDFHRNTDFYDKLFILLEKYDCKLELHTSIVDTNFDYSDCERVVFHFTMPNQIKMLEDLYFARGGLYLPEHVRVVYVVQEHYSKHLIKQIAEAVEYSSIIDELSFRQMIDKSGNTAYYLHDYLKEGHKKDWYYIEQADYNEYFVQDHIEREYLGIK